MALVYEQFSEFYEAVHGDKPFDWQEDFAKQVLTGDGWPTVIRVPTGCGKTSVLDVALFELAIQAGRKPNQRTAARRICFVVDRRLVVDEVTDHAKHIRQKVREAGKPLLRKVADALKRLAADESDPLRVVRLRGGVYCDDGWAADPLTPTILISTVDQIGSRLLFRGYGVSPRSRPVHAGLLAFDMRIILDEAHLSTAFAETLDRVRQYQQWAEQSPLPESRSVSVVRMSATAGDGERVFELSEQHRKDPRLRPRLEARKPADLIEVPVEKIKKENQNTRNGREQERKNKEAFIHNLVEHAKRAANRNRDNNAGEAGRPCIVGVVVNRVATARQVFELLNQVAENEPPRDAILLTGRIRPYDRDRLLRVWLPKIKAKRDTQPDKALFVVATQTVEVGANLDFDALVTEAAPLDALRQRFGRLFRIPDQPEQRPTSASAVILVRSDRKAKSEDDPIYGQAIAETWKRLNSKDWRGKSKRIDFGVNRLDPKVNALKQDELREIIAPVPAAPLLFPAHLDAWVQTNPVPEPDPDVAPFLHGEADARADVQVVWRADLNKGNQSEWGEIVSLMPPRTREALAVPVYEVQAWLRKQAEGDVADIEGGKPGYQGSGRKSDRRILRWRGPDDAQVVGPARIRSGDTIIVPASYGGADEFGWNPKSDKPVTDVAEACLSQLIASYPQNAFRRPKLRVRLHRDLLPQTDAEARRRLCDLLDAAVSVAQAEGADPWPHVQQLLSALYGYVDEPAHRAAIEALCDASTIPTIERYPDGHGLAVTGASSINLGDELACPWEETEHDEPSDDDASLSAYPVPLTEHTCAVEVMAVGFARLSGLEDEPFVKAISLAAQWHDQGKRDRRFQSWLHGSEITALAGLAADRPLAKSGRDPKMKTHRFGYPRGGRHEYVSVRLFDKAGAANCGQSELARLLIGTHHGYGRAFAPVLNDAHPIPVVLKHDGSRIEVSSDHRLYRLDSGWVDLFWRMVRRYGWWGSAYLESLLITADRLVSAQEQHQQMNALPGEKMR